MDRNGESVVISTSGIRYLHFMNFPKMFKEPRGVFVNFFGRPASAHKAVALMAIEFQARIFVIGVPRVALPMRYEFICADVIDPADYADSPDPVKAITQRYHTAIESLVRKYPEQYFWLHRRWKTRPKSERTANVA